MLHSYVNVLEIFNFEIKESIIRHSVHVYRFKIYIFRIPSHSLTFFAPCMPVLEFPGHLKQDFSPVCDWKKPSGQGKQGCRPIRDTSPGGQGTKHTKKITKF